MNMSLGDIELLRSVMPGCDVKILGFGDHTMQLRIFYNREIHRDCIEMYIPPRDANDQDILRILNAAAGVIGYKFHTTETFDNGVIKRTYIQNSFEK